MTRLEYGLSPIARGSGPRFLHQWAARCPFCDEQGRGGFYVNGNDDHESVMAENQALSWHRRHMRECRNRPPEALPFVATSVTDTWETDYR